MLTFTTEKIVTAILRQTYSGSPAVSSFSSVGAATCYLRPLTEEQSALNGLQFGKGFSAIFEVAVDVREGDKIVIDSIEYTVRGVVNHDRGGLTKYKRCVVTKPEKT